MFVPCRAILLMAEATGHIDKALLTASFFLLKAISALAVSLIIGRIILQWGHPHSAAYSYYMGTTCLTFSVLFIYVTSLRRDLVDIDGLSVHEVNTGYVFSHLLAFCIGACALSAQRFQFLVLFSWLLMAGYGILHVSFADMSLSFDQFDPEKLGVYLLYGDSFALWSLFTISSFSSPFSRVVLICLSILISFLLFSRTSFYGFLFAIGFLFLIGSRRDRTAQLVMFLTVLFAFPLTRLNIGSDHRMFEFLFNRDDGSLLLRQQQADFGYSAIASHWLLGDYAGQVDYFGSFGNYIHNLISYWQQFGIVPFLGIVLMIAMCVKLWWQLFRLPYASRRQFQAFHIILPFVVFEVVLSRSYTFSYLWLALGMYADKMLQKAPLYNFQVSCRAQLAPRSKAQRF